MMINPTQIKQFRQRNRVSQAKLAEMLGVSRRTIQNYEEGRTIPKARSRQLNNLLVDSDDQNYEEIRAEVDKLKKMIAELQAERVQFRERCEAKLDVVISTIESLVDRMSANEGR